MPQDTFFDSGIPAEWLPGPPGPVTISGSVWDFASIVSQEIGMGSLDANKNLVLPAGSWQISFGCNIGTTTPTSGDVSLWCYTETAPTGGTVLPVTGPMISTPSNPGVPGNPDGWLAYGSFSGALAMSFDVPRRILFSIGNGTNQDLVQINGIWDLHDDYPACWATAVRVG